MFCARRPSDDPAAMIALTSFGCFVMIAVATATVAMMWQVTPLFFLIAGSSEGFLLGRCRSEAREAARGPELVIEPRFRRVMT